MVRQWEVSVVAQSSDDYGTVPTGAKGRLGWMLVGCGVVCGLARPVGIQLGVQDAHYPSIHTASITGELRTAHRQRTARADARRACSFC